MKYSPLLLLSLLLLVTACDSPQQKEQRSSKPHPVVVYKAAPVTLTDQLSAMGTATANESVDIAFSVGGRLKEINFSDGQAVHKGDLIARLDRDEAEQRLATANIQLAEHQREIARLTTLIARKAAPARSLDERKTLAAVAASTIEQLQSQLADHTIRAPFDGRLGMRNVSLGALVQPATVITTLDDMDPMKVDFTVPSTALQSLQSGTAIIAESRALQGQVFHGVVTTIDTRIDPLTRSILLRATIANPEGRLIPGMLMSVTVHQHEREAIVVPEESVTQKRDQHFITLVKEDDTAELRQVQIGQRRDGVVEISDGLAAGEWVVVRGMGFVRSGQAVTISKRLERITDVSSFEAQ